MLALLAWHSCIVAAAKANVGRSWPRFQRSFAQRMACMHAGSISHEGAYFPSHLVVLYGSQCHARALFVLVTRMVDGVKIVEFSNTVLLSRPRHTDHGTLRGSASFALVLENEWSKVRWILHQVSLYMHHMGAALKTEKDSRH